MTILIKGNLIVTKSITPPPTITDQVITEEYNIVAWCDQDVLADITIVGDINVDSIVVYKYMTIYVTNEVIVGE